MPSRWFWLAVVTVVMALTLPLTLAFQSPHRPLALSTKKTFSSSITPTNYDYSQPTLTRLMARAHHNHKEKSSSSLLQEFSIASGEIINPYEILKVPRRAERSQIRSHYIQLSRRFHPDAMRRDGILPGSCNNLYEVREQWERIKLAYEILTDPQRRRRYDRHEALADPGQAVQRAAVTAALRGVTGMGQGMWNVGAFAVQSLANQARATTAVMASRSNNNNISDTSSSSSVPQQDQLHP